MKEREFLENQLNTEKLTPLQQQGIEIAMRKYAEYYHKEELSKLSQHDVIKNEVSVCLLGYSFEGCTYTEPKHEACKYCDKFKQTVL